MSTNSAPNSANVNLHSLSINPNSGANPGTNSATTPTSSTSNSGFVLKITNIPSDLTYREATIIFSLVIDHILKIELNSKDSYILAFFNNFNTCLTTYKLLNQKCIFGNDTPINVEIDESLTFEFNNLALRNGSLNNGSMSAPASAISIHPSSNGSISTIVPTNKPPTSNAPPASSGTIGSSSNRSRFSFNDPFHEFDPNHPHDQANPGAVNQTQSAPGPLDSNNTEINNWTNNNQLNSQTSSQPQTPVNNLNFDWNQSTSASLASKNSSNRRTSSAFFQSNFSNNLLSNSFMNSNLNQPLLNQQPMPMGGQLLLNQSLVGQQPNLQQGQQPQQQGQQGLQLQQSQGQTSQAGQQAQSQGSNQGQPQPSSTSASNPPSQNGLISNASQQPSNNSLSLPTPTASQSQGPNISPPSGTSQLLSQQPPQSQQTQSQPVQQQSQNQSQTTSNIASPEQQGATNLPRKDVPDLSLLARVPPPANPADQNPPCNTLYVGNLPPDATEQELRALFSPQKGFRRLLFRTKTNNNPGSSNHGPMCFVEFEDVAHATRALAELYGRILPRSSSSNGKGGIRLSFSKNPLGVRGPQRRSSSNQVNGGFNYNYHMKPT